MVFYRIYLINLDFLDLGRYLINLILETLLFNFKRKLSIKLNKLRIVNSYELKLRFKIQNIKYL